MFSHALPRTARTATGVYMSKSFSLLVQMPFVRGHTAERESLGSTPKFCLLSSAQVVAAAIVVIINHQYCYVMLQLCSPSSKMLFLPQPFLPLITTKKMALTFS